METYKIIRFHFSEENMVIETGLTLEDAQEHCESAETSSSTCSEAVATANPGKWFDGYTED